MSEQALEKLRALPAIRAANEIRLENGVRMLTFHSKQVQLPDSKGLADLAVLIGAGGAAVHVLAWGGHELPRMGADPVLDKQAKTAFRARLDYLAEGDRRRCRRPGPGPRRGALAQNATRSSLSWPRPRASAAGTGGSATKPSAHERPSAHACAMRCPRSNERTPQLAVHLRSALRMGTVCSYSLGRAGHLEGEASDRAIAASAS